MAPGRKTPTKLFFEESVMKWVYVLPMFIFLLVVNIIPLLWTLGLSFYNYSMVFTKPGQLKFVGFENYSELFSDPYYWERFRLLLIYVFVAVSLEFVIGVSLGFLFSSRSIRGARILIPLMTTPMMIAPVTAGVFFRFLYEPTWGVINYFLYELFGFRILFLQDARYALISVILADVWMWSPFIMLMTISALQTVPPELMELAEIERIPLFMKLRYILFPYIRPFLVLALLLRTIDAFKTFDLVVCMTWGGPGTATELLTITLYREAFAFFHTGFASAIAIIFLVITIILTSIYITAMRRA